MADWPPLGSWPTQRRRLESLANPIDLEPFWPEWPERPDPGGPRFFSSTQQTFFTREPNAVDRLSPKCHSPRLPLHPPQPARRPATRHHGLPLGQGVPVGPLLKWAAPSVVGGREHRGITSMASGWGYNSNKNAFFRGSSNPGPRVAGGCGATTDRHSKVRYVRSRLQGVSLGTLIVAVRIHGQFIHEGATSPPPLKPGI